MIIRVPLPRRAIQYERSESLSEVAQEAIGLWHQEIREAAYPPVQGGLGPIARAHLVLELCYGPPKSDGLYRPQSLGEAHRLVTHAIRGLIQAGVLIGDTSMSATRESVVMAAAQWCDHGGRTGCGREGVWISAVEEG